MPLHKSNSNNDVLIDDRRAEETWESFLHEFPGAAARENDIDRVLAALFDAPFASGGMTAPAQAAPVGSRGAGETDPLRLFPPVRAEDAPAPPEYPAGAPADIAMGETTPAQRRAMLAALAACLGAPRQSDTGTLFTQSFLPVYRREMANAAGED